MIEIGFREQGYKDRKERKKKEFKIEKTKITVEDVKRNMNKVRNGKPLDIPLRLLNGKLKKSHYINSGWRKDNKIRVRAQHSFWYHKTKLGIKKLNCRAKWCLWFLYYYNKYLEDKKLL